LKDNRIRTFVQLTLLLGVVVIGSCSQQQTSSAIDPLTEFEIPFIDLRDLWLNTETGPLSQCIGSVESSAELNNARVELRDSDAGGTDLCIFGRQSDNSWAKIAGTFLPSFSYKVFGETYTNGYVNPDGSNAPWWDCSDSSAVKLDSTSQNNGFITIAIRRTWDCRGEAGGTYKQGLLTLFVDANDPQDRTQGLSGFEILDFEQLSGVAYTSQYQFCAATGFCNNEELETGKITSEDQYPISILKQGNILVVHEVTGKFKSSAATDKTLFATESLPCLISDMCDGQLMQGED
jgi:hypothetical protein